MEKHLLVNREEVTRARGIHQRGVLDTLLNENLLTKQEWEKLVEINHTTELSVYYGKEFLEPFKYNEITIIDTAIQVDDTMIITTRDIIPLFGEFEFGTLVHKVGMETQKKVPKMDDVFAVMLVTTNAAESREGTIKPSAFSSRMSIYIPSYRL